MNLSRKYYLCIILASSLSTFYSGCGKSSSGISDEKQKQLYSKYKIDFDSEMSESDQGKLTDALKGFTKLDLETTPGSTFDKIFVRPADEPAATGVVDYLAARIHFFFTDSDESEEATSQFAKVKKVTTASNYGFMLWIYGLLKDDFYSFKTTSGQTLTADSTRAGIIGVTKYLFRKQPLGIEATLIHEARHSDCPGGLTRAQINRAKEEKSTQNIDPVGRCGHSHIKCPKGHSFAGLFACEDVPYGAYFVDAVYSKEQSKDSCKSCSDEDKSVAEISALDALSRVLTLKDFEAGNWGEPDLSSSNVIREE